MDGQYFHRNRRNLMVSTTLLFAYYLTDSNLESIAGYGARLHIGNPEKLLTLAWWGWGYLVVRYIQAFNEKAAPIYREGYSRLIKKKYIESLGVDMDSISDFGFLDRMVLVLDKKYNTSTRKKVWKFSVKMKDPGESAPYFIHHASGTLTASEARKLKRYARLKAFVIYPHFAEYIFPLLYAASLPIWKIIDGSSLLSH